MSVAFDMFEPESFIPNDLRPPNVNFRSRKTKWRVKPCFPKPFRPANKRIAYEAPQPNWPKKTSKLENSMSLDPNRLSKRLGNGKGKGPSRVSIRLDDALPKKIGFQALKKYLISKSPERQI